MAAIAARDLLRAFGALDAIADECGGADDFARAGVRVLPRLVGSELTFLSQCDLSTNRRRISGVAADIIDRRLLEAFERRLREHPLIAVYRVDLRATTRRLRDAIGHSAFLRSPLFEEYYRPLGLRHTVAVPLHVDRRRVVAFVLHRDGLPFRDADLALLERIRPQLAALHRLAIAARAPTTDPSAVGPRADPLTRRERDVVGWLSAGKTNRDIASILGASPRTVEKHLEHIYVKLGVETRTAAVMRAGEARSSV